MAPTTDSAPQHPLQRLAARIWLTAVAVWRWYSDLPRKAQLWLAGTAVGLLLVGGILAWSVYLARNPVPSAPTTASPPPSAHEPVRTTQREVIGYTKEWVPGRPLQECLGPDKEMNDAVKRCRFGYVRKVPVYAPPP